MNPSILDVISNLSQDHFDRTTSSARELIDGDVQYSCVPLELHVGELDVLARYVSWHWTLLVLEHDINGY